MATYLGVKAVREHGTKLNESLSWKQPEAPMGKRLVAIANNGAWEVAQDVTSPFSYDELYIAYREGVWHGCEFYLLDARLVNKCPNEGRNPIREITMM